jgi:hypothetical protein
MRIAGQDFELDLGRIEREVSRLVPEPIQEHYVVVAGRRFPPKQVLAAVTGLDRADFTTHQARSVLRRLGFAVHRRTRSSPASDPERGPHGGAEAEALRPYAGQWVAQRGIEVIFADPDPVVVVRWLRQHNLTAAVFGVPAHATEAGSAMTAGL